MLISFYSTSFEFGGEKMRYYLNVTLVMFLLIAMVGCGEKETITIIEKNNTAPVANAGPPQSHLAGTTVYLNGSGSTDQNGDSLSYAWKMEVSPAGSTATLANENMVNPSFFADRGGTYVISLIVNDDTSNSLPAYATVLVTDQNTVPIANAGADQEVNTNTLVSLSATGSYDGDGDPLTYLWTMGSKPVGSSASLANSSALVTTFTADIAGVYTISLIVNDGHNSSLVDTVTVTASFVNAAPVANGGPDQNIMAGATVSLDGVGSTDANADLLAFSWSMTSKPAGSQAALSGTTSASPSFTADKDGIYIVSLTVNDGTVDSSLPDTVQITAHKPIVGLSFNVVDAEYSRTTDKIIVVSASPANQLHIYDPATDSDVAVDLVLPPSAVSISPDGLYAAVGHNGWISYVSLATATVEKQLAVSTNVIDIVLAGNGFIYAFPRTDQWETIRCIEIATGTETTSGGYSIYAGTLAKLHPNGTAIYGADNGLSPSDIEKYDITNGTATMLYDSPYHGDYAMCGNLWIAEDGLRIFTACGNVFRSSAIYSEDMTYNGSLNSLSLIVGLDHSSAANKVVAIPGNGYSTSNNDIAIQFYGYDFLSFQKTISLPKFLVQGNAYSAHGKFTFFNAAGDSVYVIMKADNTSGLLYDYGITTYAVP